MNQYELALVFSSELDEEGLVESVNKVTQWINDHSGTVQNVDNWGRRKLAYPIRKLREGYYVFIQAEMPPTAVKAIEENFNITEDVLRYLVLRTDE